MLAVSLFERGHSQRNSDGFIGASAAWRGPKVRAAFGGNPSQP
jgi:hypothetical protein